MKASLILLFACVIAAAFAQLKSGNVLPAIGDGWGKNFITDLIFIILSPFGAFWCNLMGFFGGLGGDELTAFQKCWAGWFAAFY